ncbi:MAG: nucleotide 5'-monophosphate nucleosidase PpnN [Cellvibrionaceae bacterium]|nr:nucleotide 5'-monophosphate nucleosidase PpnN [Cellvibrionaceae bacterium]
MSLRVTPEHSLDVLSQIEVVRMAQRHDPTLYDHFRRCALAVLNTGTQMDDTQAVLAHFADFSVDVIQQERGIKLDIKNAPDNAFVDGTMIAGIKEHLFSVLRDIIYIHNELRENRDIDFSSTQGITNAVFHIVRNAGLLSTNSDVNMIVCWGGHSINEVEYDYSKEVGYQMGLRGLDICTGCGPGAMKGPMKGATFGHAKMRFSGRYVGISEPGIIAAESPNPIVNKLIIMPDIEKRLEAFVRTGHGVLVFPGGVGTAEEILYILGILLHPDNANLPFPLLFTGPASAREYFEQINAFVGVALGAEAQSKYDIITDDPVRVAQKMKAQMDLVKAYRRKTQDAYYYNWVLKIPEDLQHPFNPTHESMAALDLHKNQPAYLLAANLRKAFSGIVDGNVKEHGVRAVAEKGPYHIRGDREILGPLGDLLSAFVAQKRMKIPTQEYIPCYTIVE